MMDEAEIGMPESYKKRQAAIKKRLAAIDKKTGGDNSLVEQMQKKDETKKRRNEHEGDWDLLRDALWAAQDKFNEGECDMAEALSELGEFIEAMAATSYGKRATKEDD